MKEYVNKIVVQHLQKPIEGNLQNRIISFLRKVLTFTFESVIIVPSNERTDTFMKNPTYKTYASRNSRMNVKAIIIMALAIAAFLIVGHIESHYNMTAIVTYINSNDYVTVVDAKGDVWAFYGTDFSVGDEVKLKMFTKGTDSIYDDEVVKAVKV